VFQSPTWKSLRAMAAGNSAEVAEVRSGSLRHQLEINNQLRSPSSPTMTLGCLPEQAYRIHGLQRGLVDRNHMGRAPGVDLLEDAAMVMTKRSAGLR
jgi:hypothetical protein